MLYEVKIYDGSGNLVNIISRQDLERRSTDYVRAQLTERDREHILSLTEDGQTPETNPHCIVA